jgi:hypothetical protein
VTLVGANAGFARRRGTEESGHNLASARGGGPKAMAAVGRCGSKVEYQHAADGCRYLPVEGIEVGAMVEESARGRLCKVLAP